MTNFIFFVKNTHNLLSETLKNILSEQQIPVWDLSRAMRFGLTSFQDDLRQQVQSGFTPVIIGWPQRLDFEVPSGVIKIGLDVNTLIEVKTMLKLEYTRIDNLISAYLFQGLEEVFRQGASIDEIQELRERNYLASGLNSREIACIKMLVNNAEIQNGLMFIDAIGGQYDDLVRDEVTIIRHKSGKSFDLLMLTDHQSNGRYTKFFGRSQVIDFICSLNGVYTTHLPVAKDQWFGLFNAINLERNIAEIKKLYKYAADYKKKPLT